MTNTRTPIAILMGIALSTLAAPTFASADIQILGENDPIIFVSPTDTSDSFPLVEADKYPKANTLFEKPTHKKLPDYYVFFGFQKLMEESINSKLGGNVGAGWAIENYDVELSYVFANTPFSNVENTSILDANVAYRFIDEPSYRVKLGGGYSRIKLSGDNITYSDGDNKTKTKDWMTDQAFYGLLGVTTNLSKNLFVNLEARYNFKVSDYNMTIEDGKSREITSDLSYSIGLEYQLNNRIGLSLTRDFGSTFQKAYFANVKLSF